MSENFFAQKKTNVSSLISQQTHAREMFEKAN